MGFTANGGASQVTFGSRKRPRKAKDSAKYKQMNLVTCESTDLDLSGTRLLRAKRYLAVNPNQSL